MYNSRDIPTLSDSNTDAGKILHPPAEFEKDLMFKDAKKIKALAFIFFKLQNYLPDGPY